MAWVAETAKTPPPHALDINAGQARMFQRQEPCFRFVRYPTVWKPPAGCEIGRRRRPCGRQERGALDAETERMDLNHRDLMIRTRELIEITRREILQLREDIESARDTIERSKSLLSRTQPSSQPARMFRPKPLNSVGSSLM
jgi:hypothetical protein